MEVHLTRKFSSTATAQVEGVDVISEYQHRIFSVLGVVENRVTLLSCSNGLIFNLRVLEDSDGEYVDFAMRDKLGAMIGYKPDMFKIRPVA
jgi:hypothetical protein